MSVPEVAKEALSRKIAAEVVLSTNPGRTMRKWRELFGIAQKDLAIEMGVSPSVLSDYEGGRRRSPGVFTLRRFVEALLRADEKRGGGMIMSMARGLSMIGETVIDIRDFPFPIRLLDVVEAIDGKVVACKDRLDESIYGYTIIDSLKAIRRLSGQEFLRVMGMTSERALVFTGVTTGRSPMIAIRVHTLKPRAVVLQGPVAEGEVDDLARELATQERIPLVVTPKSVEELREVLVRLSRGG